VIQQGDEFVLLWCRESGGIWLDGRHPRRRSLSRLNDRVVAFKQTAQFDTVKRARQHFGIPSTHVFSELPERLAKLIDRSDIASLLW
jgi:hypothetical protein